MALTNERELQRLMNGPLPGETPQGWGTTSFTARCRGQADTVLANVREVLHVVLQHHADDWPADDAWRVLLPSWFVERCAEDPSQEEADAQLARWQRLSWKEKVRMNQEEIWSVEAWIYWFLPEQREWYWWNAVIESPDVLRIDVEHTEWPFPSDALDWLLRASGAVSIRKET